MNDLPEDILVRVLSFLVDDGNTQNTQNDNKILKVYPITNHKVVTQLDRTASTRIRGTFWCLADLRRVNKYWKQVLDGEQDGSKIWYQAAQGLGLEPPPRLFYTCTTPPPGGGSTTPTTTSLPSYQRVCQLLLQAEEDRERVMAGARRLAMKSMCRMSAPPKQPFPPHPNLKQAVIKLPSDMQQRISDNALALKSFLGSIHYCLDQKPLQECKQQQKKKTKKRKITTSGSTSDSTDCEDGNDTDLDSDTYYPDAEEQQSNFDARSALFRYRLFLQLKKSHPNLWLVPTADIEFCWLAHIFRTELYWNDMTALEIDPRHPTCLTCYGEVASFSAAVEGTAILWESTFGIPYLPHNTETSQDIWRKVDYGSKIGRCDPKSFFPVVGLPLHKLPTTSNSVILTVGLTVSDIQADLGWFPELELGFAQLRRHQYKVLLGSVGWSRDAQVSRDALLRNHLLPSYERFLNLCHSQAIQEKHISPPYVLDLIWHAHQMEPVSYKNDCLSLFHREFWHHPWPKELGESVSVSEEFHCAWKTRYGTTMDDDWKLSISLDATAVRD